MRHAQPSWHTADAYYDAGARGSGGPYPGPVGYPQAEHGLNNAMNYASVGAAGSAGQPAQEAWRTAPMDRAHPVPLQNIQAIVKNTFVDVVDVNEETHGGMRRSASDSDLSRSSEEKLHFWLPSLTSSSGGDSSESHSVATESQGRSGQWRGPWSSGSGGLRGGDADHRADDNGTPMENFVNMAALMPPSQSKAGASGKQAKNEPSSWAEQAPPQRHGNEFSIPAEKQAQEEEPEAVLTMPPEAEIPEIVKSLHEETGVPMPELMQSHLKYDLNLVPRHHVTGVILSVGTIKHREGGCSPCMFQSKKSCLKSVTCLFCHYRHRDQKVKRIRPSKRARERMKAAASQANAPPDEESSSDDEDDTQMASSSQNQPIGNQSAPAQIRNQDQPSKPSTKIRL